MPPRKSWTDHGVKIFTLQKGWFFYPKLYPHEDETLRHTMTQIEPKKARIKSESGLMVTNRGVNGEINW
jgi:hypothetical protein